MRQQLVILACICSALVYALPVSDSNSQQGLDIVQIPLTNDKELDILSLSDEGRLSERNKRTIGILRDLFPELSKQIEERVNQIVGQVIRALGPTILRTAIQGNANRARNDFDSDFDDDDDSSSGGTRVQIDLPTFAPDSDDNDDDDGDNNTNNSNTSTASNDKKLNGNGDNSIDLSTLNQQLEETIRVARQTAATEQNSVSSNEAIENNSNSNTNSNNNNDQLQQASESKAPAIDELTLDNEDDADDRNKRFLNLGFGGTASASGGAGGSAQGGASIAGSGNFLFDIIRRTADRAARAAGTVYRVVAGTETLDLNNTGSLKLTTTTKTSTSTTTSKNHQFGHANKIDRTARTINDGLFSGSIQTQGGDERANEPSSSDEDGGSTPAGGGVSAVAAAAAGGYTEGIPGPVTRLVVLANRGLANLIQDLILRIAATSERLVNFKARLITALI